VAREGLELMSIGYLAGIAVAAFAIISFIIWCLKKVYVFINFITEDRDLFLYFLKGVFLCGVAGFMGSLVNKLLF